MNKKHSVIATAIATAFIATAIQAATIANNGTLSISGQVNPIPVTTCGMAISGSGNTSITLAPVTLNTFSEVGTGTSFQTFTLAFTACPAAMTDGMNAQLTLNGTNDPNNKMVFENTGTATGVAVQIQETTGTPSNMMPNTLNTQTYAITGGAFNAPLQVNIVSTTEQPATGTVIAAPTVQIDYQ